MNVKFILFAVAGLGSLMMFYMWFSMSSTVKESQLMEEQYNYKINSLKSDIEVEKNLMKSLRKDLNSNSHSINEKTSLVDKLNKKGLQLDKDKVKLEKEMDTLRMDLDKLTKSNEEQMKKMEIETDEKLKDDNVQINNLEHEIKKLLIEKNDLIKKLNKDSKPTKIEKVDSAVDNVMQGKPPKIKQTKLDKINLEKKDEQKQNDQKNEPKNNLKEEQKQNDQKNEPKNNLKADIQLISNPESNKNQLEGHDLKKEKLRKDTHNDSQLALVVQNPKLEILNENTDSKQALVKNGLSNVHSNKKDSSQLLSPENHVKEVNDLNQNSQSIVLAKPVKGESRQLKSPKNDKDVKDININQPVMEYKNHMNGIKNE